MIKRFDVIIVTPSDSAKSGFIAFQSESLLELELDEEEEDEEPFFFLWPLVAFLVCRRAI